MRGTRELLVTCDDLGYHPTLNDAIVDILARSTGKSTDQIEKDIERDPAARLGDARALLGG